MLGRYVRRLRSGSFALRKSTPEFLWLWARVERSVPGWTRFEDLRLLYDLAWRGPGEGSIVEIGSAWGKSTIFLAAGARRRGKGRVFAVDHHAGDPALIGATLRVFRRADQRRRVGFDKAGHYSSLEGFCRNIARFGLGEVVEPVVMSSAQAARGVDTGPVRLLFIDGLHTYEAVTDDIRNWAPRVSPGGIVIFDDYYSPGCGVAAAVEELRASGDYERELHSVQGLFVWLVKR